MNLVVGATGMVGSEICKRLAARGKQIRVLGEWLCQSGTAMEKWSQASAWQARLPAILINWPSNMLTSVVRLPER